MTDRLGIVVAGSLESGVEVKLDANVLSVRGMTRRPDDDLDGAIYSEYDSGNYERSFSISSEIDKDGINALMRNGVLTLTLTKVKPGQKLIDVQTG